MGTCSTFFTGGEWGLTLILILTGSSITCANPMRYLPIYFTVCFISILLSSCHRAETWRECDVLVLGEGTGAVAAAIQSARSGAHTVLINPQPWLGGMLTSAGVSATDGNHRLPAGLWGEFRDRLRQHYGGEAALSSGWVSNTLFEPKVGAEIWLNMANAESRLSLWQQAHWTAIEKKGRWQVTVHTAEGETIGFQASILIDGTDLGDVAAAAGAAYSLGMDAASDTGEAMAPAKANAIVQDLTWVAILQDYGTGADKTIPAPPGYDPARYHCSCRTKCDDEKAHECDKMLSYARLPNGMYMINWPIHGNDFYANVAEMNEAQRAEAYARARAQTLGFVHYMQQELGYAQLGLAEDEFPTDDLLALMPYHREGRRVRGLTQLNVNHILSPYEYPHYRAGIAVGDYPIDHHHGQNPEAPEIDFPPVPSFSIPAGCLIPAGVDHLLIADKAISVTNIVNGASRLQPVVIQLGQVAGLMGAMSAARGLSPADLSVREVQEQLLKARGYLLPFIDVPPDHPNFAAVQRVGATGILQGRGVPYQWANQTWFDVDSTMTEMVFCQRLSSFFGEQEICKQMTGQPLRFDRMIELIDLFPNTYRGEGRRDNPLLTKGEIAAFIDQYLDPFHAKGVDFSGNWQE